MDLAGHQYADRRLMPACAGRYFQCIPLTADLTTLQKGSWCSLVQNAVVNGVRTPIMKEGSAGFRIHERFSSSFSMDAPCNGTGFAVSLTSYVDVFGETIFVAL